jgi:hypothetical protein
MVASVPVLSVSDGRREFVGYLTEGGQLSYSYRQSVYAVTVYEEFERVGDRLEFREVKSDDIRAIEYFRWDSAIRQEGASFVSEPPTSDVGDLVIRISLGAQQQIRTGDWRLSLADRFGDTVVRVKVERPPVLLAFARGLVW